MFSEVIFLFCFFLNIIWCLFLIASWACKNIYLSVYLKEVRFRKKFILFYFFIFLLFF